MDLLAGPGFKSSLPIKWKIVDDPIDGGGAVQTDDPAAAGGRFGQPTLLPKRSTVTSGCTLSC